MPTLPFSKLIKEFKAKKAEEKLLFWGGKNR